MTKPYRPVNGTEGEIFEGKYCNHCRREPIGDSIHGCSIRMRVMVYEVGHKLYPKQWIEIDGAPQCTAFDDRAIPAKPRRRKDRIDIQKTERLF